MKKNSRLILIIFFILIQSVLSFASSNVIIEKSNNVPSKPIELTTDDEGLLDTIKYTTSATGATSGIRYRFTELKVGLGEFTYILDTKNLVGANPPAGKTEYYDITITRENIIASIEKQYGRELTYREMEDLERAFARPNRITLGGTVEIYNASTGQVIDTLRNANELTRARQYGFSNHHIQDMLTRFNEKMPLPHEEKPQGGGLKPGIIVK